MQNDCSSDRNPSMGRIYHQKRRSHTDLRLTVEVDGSDAPLRAVPVVLEFILLIEVGFRGLVPLQTRLGDVAVLTRLLAARPDHVHQVVLDGVVSVLSGLQIKLQSY